jgi:hypothetical protein
VLLIVESKTETTVAHITSASQTRLDAVIELNQEIVACRVKENALLPFFVKKIADNLRIYCHHNLAGKPIYRK